VVFAIDINYLHDYFSIVVINWRKIAVTISQMQGSKALHHAARKMRVCNIFNAECKKCGKSTFLTNSFVTSLTIFYRFLWNSVLAFCLSYLDK
jgi:hypothetical protein